MRTRVSNNGNEPLEKPIKIRVWVPKTHSAASAVADIVLISAAGVHRLSGWMERDDKARRRSFS